MTQLSETPKKRNHDASGKRAGAQRKPPGTQRANCSLRLPPPLRARAILAAGSLTRAVQIALEQWLQKIDATSSVHDHTE